MGKIRNFVKFICESCNKTSVHESHIPETVCKKCDKKEMRAYFREIRKKEKLWAKTHKCRKCKIGLPLTRYFECEDCKPQWLSESDDSITDSTVWI